MSAASESWVDLYWLPLGAGGAGRAVERLRVRGCGGCARAAATLRPYHSALRIFRYEVRRWRGGLIPDVDEAVESPQRLTDDADVARRVLDLVAAVPAPVWGRDELAAGEMWNSNSVIAWLIARRPRH